MNDVLGNIDNTVQDDHTTEGLEGGPGSDHLIHHRDPSVQSHSSFELAGFSGNDILEASVPNVGQVHMFGATGDDWFVLDVTKAPDAMGTQGHHAYGGSGQDTFQFTNIDANASPIIGRLDDFDPTSDRILIEDMEIDLRDLPKSVVLPSGKAVDVRVIDVEHPEFSDEELGSQQFLAIGDNIFYALEGARDLQNGTSGLTGEERHFLLSESLDTLRSAETVQYENPKNFVPEDFYEHREDDLELNWNPAGAEVFAETGDKSAAHMFNAKSNHHAASSPGEQVMHGSDGDDVIDANTGNDTVFGGQGNDLIAGGIDDDVLEGGVGNDMIWGGDGDDSLEGGSGDDYLNGGRGDDSLSGGEGHDTLFGNEGDDTLEGGGGEDAVNRFHFYEDGGADIITDFKVGLDLITLQDDIDPASVELYENEEGNTVLNYGPTGSVELSGVTLEDFEESAETREEEGNPILKITTDPEEEMLQELRLETGYYGDAEPPDLEVEGVEYGSAPLHEPGTGDYAYVSETEAEGHRDEGTPSDEDDGSDEEVEPSEPPPVIPPAELDPAREEESSPEDDEENHAPTCFIATAAYADPWHPDVVFLRAFRDTWLVHRGWGRVFIAFYWKVGPKIADTVRRSPRLARSSKVLISGIVRLLRMVW